MTKELKINKNQTNSLRVLVVDDDYDDFLLIEDATKTFPYPIDITHLNKSKNLQIILDQNMFDIIFLDLYMPVKSGMKCLSEIKQHAIHKDVPVVFLTGIADETEMKRSKLLGANDYIIKPYSVKDMSVVLKHLFVQLDLKLNKTQ